MSLIQFLRILMARRMIVLTTFLSCLAMAILTVLIVPPRYDASTKVMLNIIKPDPVTGEMLGGNLIRAYVQTQMELIKNTRTTGLVVDQLGWATNPELVAQFARKNREPGIDIREWLARQISQNTQASGLEGSNIIEIKYSGDSPEAARQIVELVRNAYFEQSVMAKRETSTKAADWYYAQAEKANKALELAEGERTKFAKASNIPLQADNSDLETSRMNALNAQSVSALNVPAAASIAAAAPLVVPIPVSPFKAQLDQLDQQIAQAATTLGPNHPGFQALQRQRSALAATAAKDGQVMRVQAPSAPRAAGGGGGSLEGAYQAQKARVIANQEKVDKLTQMKREIDLKRDQYQKSAQRAAELRLESENADPGISNLGPPTTSPTPSFPKIPLVLGAAIGFGLGLGVLLGLLAELLNRRVRSDDDLEVASGVPVFAVIGQKRDPNSLTHRIVSFMKNRGKSRSADSLTGVAT